MDLKTIIRKQSDTAQEVYLFLEQWQQFRQEQTKRDTEFRTGGLFSILDMLPINVVKEAIELYRIIHGE